MPESALILLLFDSKVACAAPQTRQYLYFCTSKASMCTFVLVKQVACPAPETRQYLYFCTSKASIFALVKQEKYATSGLLRRVRNTLVKQVFLH
jgi:hypothetical protein